MKKPIYSRICTIEFSQDYTTTGEQLEAEYYCDFNKDDVLSIVELIVEQVDAQDKDERGVYNLNGLSVSNTDISQFISAICNDNIEVDKLNREKTILEVVNWLDSTGGDINDLLRICQMSQIDTKTWSN